MTAETATEAVELLVLCDGQGRYYLLPRAILEEARIDETHQAELAAALSGEDTTGFMTFGLSTLTVVAQGTAPGAPTAEGRVSLSDFLMIKKADTASPG